MTVAENQLIALLPRRDRAELLRECELVRLAPSMVLGMPGEITRHAYFPLDCAIALLTVNGSEPGLEVGLVGCEGMLGVQLVLGVSAVPLHALVQGAGMARRITAARFRRVLSASRALQRTLHGYVHVLMMHQATSAACTRFHRVEPRLVRWLLMTHDRGLSDSIHLTHEFLGHVLGVRRVGITGAARDLQRRGLIRYHRGLVTVLDRAGLEACACSCYAANLRAYEASAGAMRWPGRVETSGPTPRRAR